MVRTPLCAALAVLLSWMAFATSAQAQSPEEMVVRTSSNVLSEIMAAPLQAIPRAMLADAHGIAIIPNVIKGGLIIGARHGEGVLLVRNEQGAWQAPVFISLTGGNIGWQIGIQASDLLLVFKTRQSVQNILQGKLTLGADAAAAAGPVGREAAAATDGQLKAEIYTYSRSRGLFVGVSLDGSMMKVDHFATAGYYQTNLPGQPGVVPESAHKLIAQVDFYSGGQVPLVAQPQPLARGPAQLATAHLPPPPQNPAQVAGQLRAELAQTAQQLSPLLDPRWANYLALPAEVFAADREPSLAALQQTLTNYQQVDQDPQYRDLTARPEFQATLTLLGRYTTLRMELAAQQTIQNPAPPGR